jgi:uncharacterized SAM-binding protein YcdF (DUF218 family)
MRKILICLVIIIILVVITSNYWLTLIAKSLIINETPAKSDIIIVPSGNDQNLRIDYAAELYKKGFAKKILLSGTLSLEKETGVNLGKVYTVSLGVPENDILLENKSISTYENALFSKEIVKKRGYKSVLLVTYPLHTRRSRYVFKKIFPRGIIIITVCDMRSFDLNQWWKKEDLARSVVYEYLGFLWYLFSRK